MSLVGSLEDLGLGDILQIVSLSRKSGLLQLRSEEGEGRIVFCEGLVRAGSVKGEAEDLKDLLVSGRFVDEDEFQRAVSMAEAHGDPIADTLADMTNLTRERIDSLRREHVERCVFEMFAWTTGEFSFEVRDDVDQRDGDLMLLTGINPQYLTMEATRLGDEDRPDAASDDIEFGTGGEMLDPTADESFDAAVTESNEPLEEILEATDALALASAKIAGESELASEPLDSGPGPVVEPELSPTEVPVVGEPESPARVVVADESAAVGSERVDSLDRDGVAVSEPSFGSVILIDSNLTALEWQKVALGGLFRRIHIFQAVDGGISRLRQYLRRGEQPALLVADAFYGVSGCSDRAELIERLRAHATTLPIFVVQSNTDPPPSDLAPGIALLQRPPNHHLANRRAWPRFEADGDEFYHGVRCVLEQRSTPLHRAAQGAASPEGADGGASEALQRLKRTSDRLRDPSAQGEVLSLIVEFAAESFSRVAVFMVRDDDALGIVQSGLDRAGGPDHAGFEQISLPAEEPQWFREVLASRRSIAAPPRDEGDRRLAALLGSRPPDQAYVAPIESGNRVVALVYVDNLPGGGPIGDTDSLESVLREAGLALERALQRRTGTAAGS